MILQHVCFYFINKFSHLFQEAIAVGRSFASIRGYHLDGNKEMVAMGFMNIVGSLTSCYTATGELFQCQFCRSIFFCFTFSVVQDVHFAVITQVHSRELR